MNDKKSRRVEIERRGRRAAPRVNDAVVVEEPLEIRVLGRGVAVVMRTPGDDLDLAAGFVVTEGIADADDVSGVAHCVDARGETAGNAVNVALAEGASLDWERLRRNLYTSSSCGICGKATLDLVEVASPPVISNITINENILYTMAESCREKQSVFDKTGGLHAACFFDNNGKMLILREDVGRHNAVDKVVGARVRAGDFPPGDGVLFISGRGGFEILQKARVARIPIVVAVGAPTSLAVDCAERGGITLIGFLRDGSFNIYSHPRRIV